MFPVVKLLCSVVKTHRCRSGTNGFIGRALSARFRTLGAAVKGVDLTADPENDVIAGDITKPESWSAALDGVDTVVHTAALLGAAFPLEQAPVMKMVRPDREGAGRPDGVDETYPVHVNGDVYTDTKVNSEAVVLAAHAAGEIDVTVIRPGDVWGPGSVWVRSPIAEMRKATGFPLPNGANGIFSPVYIDNFVDGLVLAVASQDAVGQVLNITDGVGVRCGEFFGRVAAMCHGTIRTMPIGVAAPAADIVGAVLRRLGQKTDLSAGTMWLLNRPGTYSIDKARKLLGYQPLVSVNEGMDCVEAWLRSENLI